MTSQKWIEKLKQEGFTNMQVVRMEPGFDAGEHTHNKYSVHVILTGELIISDEKGTKTFRAGDRVEFPAGTTHIAKGGPTAGSMIIGIKENM